jgi:hypothetical protein
MRYDFIMIALSRACAALLALVLVLFAPINSQAATVTFGGYTGPTGDLRAALQDPANFGALGITAANDQGPVAFGGVTSTYLSTLDIFFTGRNAIGTAPTANDISNLVSFVNAGGSLIINNDRSTSFTALDPLLNAFGVDIVEAPTSIQEPLNILEPNHPIMDGPFGQVSQMALRDASRFAILVPSVVALASWQNGDVAMAVLEPDAGAGRLGSVVILPDVERFLLQFDSSLGSGDTQIAALNALAYAIDPSPVPLPSSLPLFATGLGLMGLFGWWRRRRLWPLKSAKSTTSRRPDLGLSSPAIPAV